MDEIRAMFLRQSLKDCEETFAEALKRRDAPTWDYLVVTAASESQAAAYRAQIDARRKAGQLPKTTRYLVIPDPGGRRVGSGGATLNVLSEIARLEGGDTPFSMKRILVLHSGGDSQRIPQYSALGKLFARVPRALPDGRASTLFDEFCIALSCVPPRMNGGLLVMSGDVLLLFNALQIDLERTGAACLSIKAPVWTGTRHGVFVSDTNGGVSRFLHKQSEETLRAFGAVNGQDMVDIDTGAIWLDETRVAALYGLVRGSEERFDCFVNDRVRLSFYADFVYPMASGSTLESYLSQSPEGEMSDELLDCRREIWRALGGTELALIRLSPAEFFHFGTTEEWRDLLLTGEERFSFLGWQRKVASVGEAPGAALINSLISPGALVGEGCAVEDSRIGEGAKIGAGCVLSGADLSAENLQAALPPDTVLHVLPVQDGKAYCARFYGVRDNPKEALRFGKPIGEPLWTAPLHPVRRTRREAIRAALSLTEAGPRMSLKESFAAASLPHLLSWEREISDEVRARRVTAALENGAYVEDVLPLLPAGGEGDREIDMLTRRAALAPFPLKHRLYYALSRAVNGRDAQRAEEMDNACWRAVNDHLLSHAMRELASLPKPAILRDKAEVLLPVRINWGGGWSDTPPYCLEHGGTVLNASLLLDGRRPIRAFAERLDEPVIRIFSDDLGVFKEYTRLEDLKTGNPHDPHALCKAALSVCGVVPERAEGLVKDVLARIGGGIALRTAVENVPKGSGLGTSSILCAAVARALSQLLGQPDDDGRISSLTLCMEQLMNTGGGWQDQIGGLLTGIKLVSSRPGTPQKLQWRRIQMTDEAFSELSDRFALVFTGQRRLARTILRDIMGKAVAGQPDTLQVLSAIQRLAVLMAFELETGDIDQFARLTREHWALSKRLDAGSSNTCIDHLVTVADDLIDGLMICGAGGGGFMGMILKKGVPRKALAGRLSGVFQESGVRLWNAQLER